MKRLLEVQPDSTRSVFHYDHSDDMVHIEKIQDVGNILETTRSFRRVMATLPQENCVTFLQSLWLLLNDG